MITLTPKKVTLTEDELALLISYTICYGNLKGHNDTVDGTWSDIDYADCVATDEAKEFIDQNMEDLIKKKLKRNQS